MCNRANLHDEPGFVAWSRKVCSAKSGAEAPHGHARELGRRVNVVQKRKLIEVALPLEAINRESAREKSIRHGHPSTLHLWWARRPLAAARAVLFAQLVDDPSSHPEEFPTEELQRKERERLHKLIERLVVWENIENEKLLAEAHAEIFKSTDGNPPPILDPFAGGGTIPLEAQRLGLEAHASDLNPVAVLINKALIEIPPKFSGRPPVSPDVAKDQLAHPWPRATGLAEDVRRYGQWMRDEAEKRIGRLYPKATLPDGSQATVIAWIWARTVTCPNPACGISMPLVRSWWLGRKKGKEAYVVPSVVDGKVRFSIGRDIARAPTKDADGTMCRAGATCIGCGTTPDLKYIRTEGQAGRMGAQLMATVAEGNRTRIYLPAAPEQEAAAQVSRPADVPDQEIPTPNHDVDRLPMYGMPRWCDAFTARQLTALTTFSDLVTEARHHVLTDGLAVGMPEGERLEVGGIGAAAYADAVVTYLGFAISRLADYGSSISTWMPDPKNEGIRNTFARQAIAMTWDFAEANPLSSSSGNFWFMLRGISRTLDVLAATTKTKPGIARQGDAASMKLNDLLLSTDPPYYNNIGYSDLSDYFYVWLRRSLRSIHPDLLSTMLVPKAEELVANPYRHGGRTGAREFFEEGFRQVFLRARESALPDFPITVYYAFKQSESTDAGEASTGWETLLEGMIRSGWEVTATWPLRSERGGRMISIGANALASSIVLALRPRPEQASRTDRRQFVETLKAELPTALKDLQQGAIAPVDLPQAAIGPGMAVFSRYSGVLEPDGTAMSVRSALARINEILDQVLNEQEGDFDATSRFAIAWYRQHGYGTGAFGDANNLANARNTTVDAMDRGGILSSRAGKVHLIKPSDLEADYDVLADPHTSNWEALHHLINLLEGDGITPAGDFLRTALSRPDGAIDSDLVKELAHLLFRVAEANGWTKDALSFNSLVTSWPEIIDAARSETPTISQSSFDFEEDAD
jgi:putative DNA methylase